MLESTRVAELLRMARIACGLPQLAWAEALNVSQRHVSFVERGRAHASRKLIVEWMHTARAPHELLTAALQRAGYAHSLREPTGAAPPLPPALRRLAQVKTPWPLLVIDADWRLRAVNAACRRLAARLMPALRAVDPLPVSLVDLLAGDAGFFDDLANAPEVARDLLTRLEQDSWLRDRLVPAYERLATVFQRRFGISVHPLHERDALQQQRLQFERCGEQYAFHVVPCSYPACGADQAPAYRIEHWVPEGAATECLLRDRMPDVECGDYQPGSCRFACTDQNDRASARTDAP